MTEKKRQPKGIPVGGQFATSAHSESGLSLDAAPTEGIARDVLAGALERHGLDETLTSLDGRTITEAWDEKFALLDGEEVPTTEQVIYDALGGINVGRHRGGPYLVWYDPTNDSMSEEDWNDEKTGQWEPVTAENLDDPRGRVLACEFYTRNGGGNRECWCNTEEQEAPDHGCTSAVVDALQARPDHIHDEDSDDDRTYASFYFRLPDDPRIAASVRREEVAREQARAKHLLVDIESGQRGVWDVFEANPETQTAREAAQEETRTPYPDRSDRTRIQMPYNADEAEAAYLDAVVKAAIAGDPAPSREGTGFRGDVGRTAIDYGARAAKAAAEAADADATLAAHAAGTLPDATLRLLGGAEGLAATAKKARSSANAWTERRRKETADIRTERDHLVNRLKVNEKREAAKARAAALEWALHWPGPADTCPPKPETGDEEASW